VSARISLPGRPEPLVIAAPPWASSHPRPVTRRVFAAAHVAAFPDGSIDWASTARFRDHLWSHGFGVAEAMDTAQRGMGLSWAQARELISRSARQAARRGVALACGVGTDQLPDGGSYRLAEITGAYEEQLDHVQSTGAQVILMASRALAATARSAADYLNIYGYLLRQADRPIILHWLGEAFDPQLHGYWGSADFTGAAATVLDLVRQAGGKVDGIKLSVLDARHEVALRRQLPAGIRLYTGDDFNYPGLIRGGPDGHSDALLGAFAAVTAPAAAALQALDAGDTTRYDEIMGQTRALSKKVFEEPTFCYKTGIAFLAWLNGLQPYFAMLDGFQGRRGAAHLTRVFELAAGCGALLEPELASHRMRKYLEAGGRP
jgi:dihydrodipicolinate synthase/N-acetylneuraminate lyase